MSARGKCYMECPTCFTLIAYLNGICPDCGGTGVVEVKDPLPEIVPEKKPEPKSVLEHF